MSEIDEREYKALKDFYEAHREMSAAIKESDFGKAYVKANRARDELVALEVKASG